MMKLATTVFALMIPLSCSAIGVILAGTERIGREGLLSFGWFFLLANVGAVIGAIAALVLIGWAEGQIKF